MARTQKSFDEKVKRLNSSSKKSAPKKPVKKSTSTKIKIIQSRKKDMFPMMNIHRFPYHFEPGPEISDRLNKAWFDEFYGEERIKKSRFDIAREMIPYIEKEINHNQVS